MITIIQIVLGATCTVLSFFSTANYLNGKYNCSPGSLTVPIIGGVGTIVGIAAVIWNVLPPIGI